ncbi:hypothetical protein DFH07DRAFT_447677 [Mycena maculata]|uniref:Uncharacterized protein n=1 Tax=Mycena maculata TaxID=230809 RepID=A0AAD7J988_9AGAR|nr:hypothetical protein DFH07DRAFT_447677 [Mycena maculata]
MVHPRRIHGGCIVICDGLCFPCLGQLIKNILHGATLFGALVAIVATVITMILVVPTLIVCMLRLGVDWARYLWAWIAAGSSRKLKIEPTSFKSKVSRRNDLIKCQVSANP